MAIIVEPLYPEYIEYWNVCPQINVRLRIKNSSYVLSTSLMCNSIELQHFWWVPWKKAQYIVLISTQPITNGYLSAPAPCALSKYDQMTCTAHPCKSNIVRFLLLPRIPQDFDSCDNEAYLTSYSKVVWLAICTFDTFQKVCFSNHFSTWRTSSAICSADC